jgi:hypothetical protein
MADVGTARRIATVAMEAVKEEAGNGEKFRGEAEKYPVWKHATSMHLEYSDLDQGGQVRYIMQRIQGDATLNFTPGNTMTSVAAIWAVLDPVYGAALNERDASFALDNLYQGRDSLADYTSKFNKLAAILQLSAASRIGKHSAHVAKHLKKEACMIQAATFQDYLMVLTRVEQATQWEQEKAARKESKASVKTDDKPRDPKGKWKARGAQEEDTRECFYCHKKGHLKKDCRALKAEKAKQAKEKKSDKSTPDASVSGEESEND